MDSQLIELWSKFSKDDKRSIYREAGEKYWEADYAIMRESMIYGDSKSFQELITSMKDIMGRFKKMM